MSLHYDCDKDTILARVIQEGPACHTGKATCWTAKPWRVHPAIDELLGGLRRAEAQAEEGLVHEPPRSTIRRVCASKLIEEVCELEMAVRSKEEERDRARRAADVLYHYLLMLFTPECTFQDVADVLERRRR
mgnify:CR=1 FL=1